MRRGRPGGGRRRLLALVTLTALIAPAWLALGAATTSAQTISALVSNVEQSDDGEVNLSEDRAMQFTTGSTAERYGLSSVELDWLVGNPNGGQPVYSVSIYSSDSSGLPDTELITLTNPSRLADGLNTFTAPDRTGLDPDTSYYIVVSVTTDGAINGRLGTTQVDEEDEGAAEGWSIGNSYAHKTRTATAWTTDTTQTPQFKVNGYAKLPYGQEVVYETEDDDYVVRNRVVRDQYGNCYRERWYGFVWQRSVSYGHGDEACRKAAWDAWLWSTGGTPLGPDGDFPTRQPPRQQVVPSCPSGWEGSTGYGRQWCHLPDQPEDRDVSLSPERAREFLASGLRPSDSTTTNKSRRLDYENFMWGADICGEHRAIGYADGGNGGRKCHPADEMVACSSGNSAGISGRRCVPARPTHPTVGHSASDPNPPATGTVIPRKIERQWSEGPIVRDDNGDIATTERDNPELACDGYTWLEHLSQWVCDGREYDPTYVPVERERAPEYVCTNYGRPFSRWVQVDGIYQWQTQRVCISRELAPPPQAPKPLGGPAPSTTIIDHTSDPNALPVCTAEERSAVERGAWVFCRP